MALLAACGAGSTPDHVPSESQPLGLNDVSMLVPLPPAGGTTLARMTEGDGLVPRALFDRLVTGPGDVIDAYEDFHLVAIRFDLCDRVAAGPCPEDDGRLRLVFQPMHGAPLEANDVGLHAFYPIPKAELGSVIDELRALAAIAGTPTTAALGVSPPLLAGNTAYATRLRALVIAYAASDRLTRLTLFAQDAMAAALIWAFRGEELRGGSFARIEIPDVAVMQQRTVLSGSDTTYNTSPVADAPAGFMLALASDRFAGATPAERMVALESLATVQNPEQHGADTVQCVACHVSTFLTARRAAVAGVDPRAIAGTFEAPYDLSTTGGISSTNDRALRAFGWVRREPAISQRVVNDTAQVLVEIADRFPPAE
jgi:hypothetical protein